MESNFSKGDLQGLADINFAGNALGLLHVKTLEDDVGYVLCDNKGYFVGYLLVLADGNFEGNSLGLFDMATHWETPMAICLVMMK